MDMKSIEVSGKTVDEAIFKGLQQLEISIDEVEIQIIKQETKGILGFGAKPAIVRLIPEGGRGSGGSGLFRVVPQGRARQAR